MTYVLLAHYCWFDSEFMMKRCEEKKSCDIYLYAISNLQTRILLRVPYESIGEYDVRIGMTCEVCPLPAPDEPWYACLWSYQLGVTYVIAGGGPPSAGGGERAGIGTTTCFATSLWLEQG